MNHTSRLLVFHRTIAPYRIDFFNDLSEAFDAHVCLQYKNLLNQKFDYDKIIEQFRFNPIYLKELVRVKSLIISCNYWKQLDEHRPDIVLVSEFGLDCIAVLLHRWLKRRAYKVVSVCDDSYNMVAEHNDFSALHRRLRKWITPKLDELILVEPKVTEWYRYHYGKGYCFPILKEDHQAREVYSRLLPKSKILAERNRLTDKRVILFVGRLVALKNVETIIEAFTAIQTDECALVIVGDGPERKMLEQLAAGKDAHILFTGRLESDELYAWYNIASVFILASYQESFGTVVNEALLAGCKSLVSCRAGSSCLIEEGKNGYTFDPTDVNDLAAKLKKLNAKVQPATFDMLRSSQMKQTYGASMQGLIHHLKTL